jgi:hypothetical protein
MARVIKISTPGPRGFQGPQGVAGPSGSIGPQGSIGPSGSIGPQGPIGPSGSIGPQGPVGPSGSIGPQGPIGPSGSIGPQGPIGPLGPIGPQGLAGPSGSQGLIGPSGSQGPLGPSGSQGPIGPSGSQGPLGPQGPQGEKGDPGTLNSFTDLIVTGSIWASGSNTSITSSIVSSSIIISTTGSFSLIQGNSPITVKDETTFQSYLYAPQHPRQLAYITGSNIYSSPNQGPLEISTLPIALSGSYIRKFPNLSINFEAPSSGKVEITFKQITIINRGWTVVNAPDESSFNSIISWMGLSEYLVPDAYLNEYTPQELFEYTTSSLFQAIGYTITNGSETHIYYNVPFIMDSLVSGNQYTFYPYFVIPSPGGVSSLNYGGRCILQGSIEVIEIL